MKSMQRIALAAMLSCALAAGGAGGAGAADNGVISAAFTQDAFKEGLLFCKKLCDAGLLAPESFTRDRTQLKAEMKADIDALLATLDGKTFDMPIYIDVEAARQKNLSKAACA